MALRALVSVLLALLVGCATVLLWYAQKEHNAAQISRIAEAESYAARSQLIRNTEVLLGALQSVRDYWSNHGHLPRDQWASDAGIELEHFEGVTMLLWDDPARGVRYTRTQENPEFDHRPSDDEWAQYESLLQKTRAAGEDSLLGPFERDGSMVLEVVYVDPSGGNSGTLAAVIDTDKTFAHMLRDESPGYSINVWSDDVLLYSRGEAAADAPSAWTREGLIQTSLGNLWRVVHAPTPSMVSSLRSSSAGLILPLGLLIALLVGGLAFENGRARQRARQAESAERELADLNRGLEQQVGDRTRELASRNADLQMLTDSVAHDLRNPLNTISVNAQLLLAQGPGALEKPLERVQSAIRQMSDILDRLFGLSLVTHSTFERESIDMCRLVDDTMQELRHCESEPDIDFRVGDLPPASADSTMVKVLLTNLLSNAVKYTRDRDQRRIEVGCESTGNGNTYFVRDNGIGFDNEAASRLFDAFQRLDESVVSDGIGLGLTIAKRAVERHGGEIWAEGERGKGATFYFTLDGAGADERAGEPA